MEDNDFNSWLAGFWEGEGCISKRKNGTGYVVRISQSLCPGRNVEEMMKKIKNIFGGNITEMKYEKYKTSLLWSIGNRRDVLKFIDTIYLYCQFRNKQLAEALIHYKKYSKYNVYPKRKKEKKIICKDMSNVWEYIRQLIYA
uniref:Putative homing endonuclease n=2 Tax=viral metagenome TaxID=1070528 RepID=A0A6H2A4D5_9ZZZZ